jgi:hypothetical protein
LIYEEAASNKALQLTVLFLMYQPKCAAQHNKALQLTAR